MVVETKHWQLKPHSTLVVVDNFKTVADWCHFGRQSDNLNHKVWAQFRDSRALVQAFYHLKVLVTVATDTLLHDLSMEPLNFD